jgi:VanZ family protein
MRYFVLKAARVTGWLLAAIIAVLSFLPPWLRPQTPMPHGLEHFAIFAITGFVFGIGYSRRPVLVMVALVIFAATIEIAQLFVPDRHARLSDFIVDALALCLGVAIAFVPARTLLQGA